MYNRQEDKALIHNNGFEALYIYTGILCYPIIVLFITDFYVFKEFSFTCFSLCGNMDLDYDDAMGMKYSWFLYTLFVENHNFIKM